MAGTGWRSVFKRVSSKTVISRAGPLTGVRLRRRIVMIWMPVCPRCGSRFTFRPDNEELLPETR
jgi:hypothetical protein